MFKTIGDWLNKMNLTFIYNEAKRAYIIPYEIDGKKFLTAIFVFPDTWIKVAALVLEASEVTNDMYKALLQENWNLFEVTYSVDPAGNIFSENDLPQNTNYENFVSEFNAVAFGVKHFFETIGPQYKVVAHGTYERNRSMWV